MGKLTFNTAQLDEGTIIHNTNGSRVGGDKSIRTQAANAIDVQVDRTPADFSHLFWTGTVTSVEDVGGGSVKILYTSPDGTELNDGDTVTISGTTSYNGVYVATNTITDVEDSFEIAVAYVASETGTWVAQRLYDRLSPNTNKNDNSWALSAQTEFLAGAESAVTIGSRCMSHNGWGGEWSSNIWGVNLGYQNIGGGIGTNIIGNNNIAENYWCSILGDHNHISEWATKAFGSWNVCQGGDGLVLGSNNNTYGWKLLVVGNDLIVSGNENQATGDNCIIHDAFGVDLNETPDAIHNRFNIAIGRDIEIGSTVDLGDQSTGVITAIADAVTPIDHIIVTSVDHGLVDGDAIEITGTINYNGKYTVDYHTDDTVIIGTTFIITETGAWNQTYTVNNVVSIGSNLSTDRTGAVLIGENLTNNYDNSIELGASDNRKLSIRQDGRIIVPSATLDIPQITDTTLDSYLPEGHSTNWYDDTGGAEKLFTYRNFGGVLQRVQIGSAFA